MKQRLVLGMCTAVLAMPPTTALYWLLQAVRSPDVPASLSGFLATMFSQVAFYFAAGAALMLAIYGLPVFLFLRRRNRASLLALLLAALVPWVTVALVQLDFRNYEIHFLHSLVATLVFWAVVRGVASGAAQQGVPADRARAARSPGR